MAAKKLLHVRPEDQHLWQRAEALAGPGGVSALVRQALVREIMAREDQERQRREGADAVLQLFSRVCFDLADGVCTLDLPERDELGALLHDLGLWLDKVNRYRVGKLQWEGKGAAE